MFTRLAFLILLSLAFIPQNSFAISEYGIRCDDNKKCVSCRNNIKCVKCLNICWNTYGTADSSAKLISGMTKEQQCQLKRAKWCSAQCWDPDDAKDPLYVSTKPNCDKQSFHMPDKKKGSSDPTQP